MRIRDFQQLIETMYSRRDRQRGAARSFLWFTEEVGELASAIASGNQHNKEEEFADVLAWLTTLANVEGVDLEQAIRKFTEGCPGCGQMACVCEAKMT